MKTCLPAGRSAFFFFRPNVSVSNEPPIGGTRDRLPLHSYGAYDRCRGAIPHSYCIEIVHRVSLPKINFLNDTTLSNGHCL